MGFSSSEFRKFLLEHFSDEEIEAICFDHFREVMYEFSTGMSKGEKISRLMEYLQCRDLVKKAFTALQSDHPELFKATFGDTIPEDVVRLFNTPEPGADHGPSLEYYSSITDEIASQHRSTIRGCWRIAAAVMLVGLVIAVGALFFNLSPLPRLPDNAWQPLFGFGVFICSMGLVPVIYIILLTDKIERCNHASLLVKKIHDAYLSGNAVFGTSMETTLQQAMTKIISG